MTAAILDGKTVARLIRQEVAERAAALREVEVVPHLVFVTVGSSPPAEMYASRLEKLAAGAGIAMSRSRLPGDVSLGQLDDRVAQLNADEEVDGIIVQMPLPDHLTPADLASIIDPRKDVDGLTIENAGRLYLGLAGQRPSTGLAMMEILRSADVDPVGKHAVVIGRSNVVGHPVAELLLEQDATVTVTHRQTRDLASVTRLADILLVGAGEPHLVTRDMVRSGVVIVDAGINVVADGVVGDVDFDACREVASAITPVPGGVGPVTNAVLLRNVMDSADRRRG